MRQRIALMGISMAGYYAPRVAAFDRRIRALVCWAGCYSLLTDIYEHYEGLRPTLRRLLGGAEDAEARRRLQDFTMAGIAGNITCPTLISHAAPDRLMAVEGARTSVRRDRRRRQGACDLRRSPDRRHRPLQSRMPGPHNMPMMLDWLEDRL